MRNILLRNSVIAISTLVCGMGFSQDVTLSGDRSIAEYLLQANLAHETSLTPYRGRLTATSIETVAVTTASNNLDVTIATVAKINAVWEGERSYRHAVCKERSSPKAGGGANPVDREEVRRILLTPNETVLVQTHPSHNNYTTVHVYPADSKLIFEERLDVLPNDRSRNLLYQLTPSSRIEYFLSSTCDEGQKSAREISVEGDIVVLRTSDTPSGEKFEMRFSLECDGRVVSYRSTPGRDSRIKFVGTIEWARDSHDVVYLKSHEYQQFSSRTGFSVASMTRKLVIEEFDSQPVIDPRELTFEGLGVPDGTPLRRYRDDPVAPVWIGTVGNVVVDVEQKELESLVEQLKTRGFARPERTK